jgi:hypothetical protein
MDYPYYYLKPKDQYLRDKQRYLLNPFAQLKTAKYFLWFVLNELKEYKHAVYSKKQEMSGK